MHSCSTLYRNFKYMLSQNCRLQKLHIIFNSIVDFWKSKCKIASFFKELKTKFVAMQGFEEMFYKVDSQIRNKVCCNAYFDFLENVLIDFLCLFLLIKTRRFNCAHTISFSNHPKVVLNTYTSNYKIVHIES